ncbi:UPF0488 protein CG14286-like [Littorina saxatilis]|uniref:Uncharacterized protein n=1 Tax=Littorina saxatilis TaxID=31220 RepID=A0AAN9G317_9CAEN
MSEDQLKVEVDWCLARLEEKLAAMDPYTRPAQEAAKVHRILKSSKAPVIKKRQAMRNMFGDYRAKMKANEKKNLSAMKKSTLVAVKDAPSDSKFLRRSAGAAPGQDSSTSSDTVNTPEDEKPHQCADGSGESTHNTEVAKTHTAEQSAEPGSSQNNTSVPLNSAEEFKFGFGGSEGATESETVNTGEGAASDNAQKNYFVMKPSSEEFRFNFTADGCGQET